MSIRADIHDEDQKWGESVPPMSGTRQGYPFSPHLCNIIVEVLGREMKQEIKMKSFTL